MCSESWKWLSLPGSVWVQAERQNYPDPRVGEGDSEAVWPGGERRRSLGALADMHAVGSERETEEWEERVCQPS